MAEYSGFFGGPEGDVPEYTQPQFAAVLKKIFDDGVFTNILNELEVVETDPVSLSVKANSGWGWIQGFWYHNTAFLTKTLAAADPDDPRIDRLILRLDRTTDFTITLEVLTGTPGAVPVAPTLTQTADIYEISLAQILVGATETSVSDAEITDERTYAAIPKAIDADTLTEITGAVLKANEIIVMANGFIIAGSDCELVEADGTAAKCYAKHLAVAKTEWFDVPKFKVPDTYDGGDINITVAFRSAAASKRHSLGIRVASVADWEPHNPDLAAAFQLYNEESSDSTIGDVHMKTVTVTQANHLMVAGEIWHCKFVMEDDAGADADDVFVDWILIQWNKG